MDRPSNRLKHSYQTELYYFHSVLSPSFWRGSLQCIAQKHFHSINILIINKKTNIKIEEKNHIYILLACTTHICRRGSQWASDRVKLMYVGLNAAQLCSNYRKGL